MGMKHAQADHELILGLQRYWVKTHGTIPAKIKMSEEFYRCVKRDAMIFAWDDPAGKGSETFFGVPYEVVPLQSEPYILVEKS
jgi:hypothetical protein